MTVKPICPYVAKFIARHPEFHDLVEPNGWRFDLYPVEV
jgi:hypothetical protein